MLRSLYKKLQKEYDAKKAELEDQVYDGVTSEDEADSILLELRDSLFEKLEDAGAMYYVPGDEEDFGDYEYVTPEVIDGMIHDAWIGEDYYWDEGFLYDANQVYKRIKDYEKTRKKEEERAYREVQKIRKELIRNLRALERKYKDLADFSIIDMEAKSTISTYVMISVATDDDELDVEVRISDHPAKRFQDHDFSIETQKWSFSDSMRSDLDESSDDTIEDVIEYIENWLR